MNPLSRLAQELAGEATRISWNHVEFETKYASLKAELKVCNGM